MPHSFPVYPSKMMVQGWPKPRNYPVSKAHLVIRKGLPWRTNHAPDKIFQSTQKQRPGAFLEKVARMPKGTHRFVHSNESPKTVRHKADHPPGVDLQRQ